MNQRSKDTLTRYPVSSFSATLLALLLKGAVERIEIPCPDQRTMRRLQARIHGLRAAMRREHHPQSDLVARARTARSWAKGQPNTDCVLVVQPQDAEFEDTLRAAGIRVTAHTRDLLADLGGPEAPLAPDDNTPAHDPYAKFKGDSNE